MTGKTAWPSCRYLGRLWLPCRETRVVSGSREAVPVCPPGVPGGGGAGGTRLSCPPSPVPILDSKYAKKDKLL